MAKSKMKDILSCRQNSNAFKSNEDGNLMLSFAVSLTMIITAVGAAVDFSLLTNARTKSQSIADNTALTAAIYIKDNNRPPTSDDDGYVDGTDYTAAELGYQIKDSVVDGADGITITVNYDDNAKEATVTVKGEAEPKFLHIFGQSTLPFSAQSVVSYLEAEDAFPASIALVLDNSGSMGWDDQLATNNGSSPAGAEPRINGLISSVRNFTTQLEDRLDTDDKPYETVRMGMLPYAADIIDANRVRIDRTNSGFLTTGQINRMVPDGPTNSSPPMTEALSELSGEEAAHRKEAETAGVAYIEPLKFVIFMSDGANTVGPKKFIPDPDSQIAYREVSDSPGTFESAPTTKTESFIFRDRWGRWRRGTRTVDIAIPAGFERGRLELAANDFTIASCNQLKADGVEIFTIGYGLDVGFYNANISTNTFAVGQVTLKGQADAFALLRDCASSPENFVRADDAAALDAAFDTIQNAIVEELIRIKS